MSKDRIRSKPTGLPIIHPFAAGIDIGSRFHVVAVSPDLCDEPVQTFQAFTSDLQRMADWLVATGTKTVAMESTGVYWFAAYEVLASRGLEVILANAREARAVPGRKSDVNDAQWLQRLHACGLLRASFRPGRDIAALPAYLRLRERHPIVYLDCIHVKVRDGTVRVKAIYLAIGINLAGEKEVLGLWIAQTEGAKFWLQAVTKLKNRGVQDILIACVDGLKGFPEAIEAVYPHAAVQLCIVHMVRNSLNYVSWKRRSEVAADLKRIYTCSTVDEAEQKLAEFEDKWDDSYLPISQSWRRNWPRIIPFFDYPPEIRKVIYTTNAIESVNMSLRKITKNRGSFPSDEALLKLFYLALRNICQKWTMPIRDWKAALNRFTIQFEERMTNL